MFEAKKTLLIILGADEWPQLDLHGSEHFTNSKTALREYFTGVVGLSQSNVLDLFNDSRGGSEQLLACGSWIKDQINLSAAGIAPITDLIIYYVGHGDFLEKKNEFYMPLRGTVAGLEMQSALRVEDLANMLHKSARFHRKFLFFDCCYAGAAASAFMGAEKSIPITQFRKATREVPLRGTALLCAASADNVAMMGESGLTMFTQAFCEVLLRGSPEAGYQFTLYELRDLIWENIKQREGARAPRPVLHVPDQSEGDIAQVGIFINPFSSGPSGTRELENSGIAPSCVVEISPVGTNSVDNEAQKSLGPSQPAFDQVRNAIARRTLKVQKFDILFAASSLGASTLLVVGVEQGWREWLGSFIMILFLALICAPIKNIKTKLSATNVAPFIATGTIFLVAAFMLGLLPYAVAFFPVMSFIAVNTQGTFLKRFLSVFLSYSAIFIGLMIYYAAYTPTKFDYFGGAGFIPVFPKAERHNIFDFILLVQPIFIFVSALALFGVSASPVPLRFALLSEWLRDNLGMHSHDTTPRYMGNQLIVKKALVAWLAVSIVISAYNPPVGGIGQNATLKIYTFPVLTLGTQIAFWTTYFLNFRDLTSKQLSTYAFICLWVIIIEWIFQRLY